MRLDSPIFTDADKAREYLEAQRWADGIICPHCGNANQERITKMEGAAHRPGLYNCKECREQFTVTVGSAFERSKIALNKWLLATFLMASSKKGMSAHQLHRMLGVTYKTAWFMAHRIREAMTDDLMSGPLGGEGKVVEADTTFIGGSEKNKHKSKRDGKKIGGMGKQIVHTLVERDGKARSHHIPNVSGKTLRPILFTQVDRKSSLMTDTAGGYHQLGKEFARHETVDHGKDEYVRGDAYSNTVEGYFATLKRGIDGTYHHVSEAHLKRYLAEFDFRYNAAPSWALAIASATTTCSRPSAASASPIGGLVKPLTKAQRIALIKRVAKRLRRLDSKYEPALPCSPTPGTQPAAEQSAGVTLLPGPEGSACATPTDLSEPT